MSCLISSLKYLPLYIELPTRPTGMMQFHGHLRLGRYLRQLCTLQSGNACQFGNLAFVGIRFSEARKGARTEEAAGEHIGDIKAVTLNLHHEAAGDGQLQKLGKGRRRDRIRKHRLERGRHIGNILRRDTHSAACTENYTR